MSKIEVADYPWLGWNVIMHVGLQPRFYFETLTPGSNKIMCRIECSSFLELEKIREEITEFLQRDDANTMIDEVAVAEYCEVRRKVIHIPARKLPEHYGKR